MSHEFRTPVSTCLMFITALLEMLSDQKAIEICNIIKCQMSFLLSLINDMLDLKMNQQGKLLVKLEKFKPMDII